jgi:hypothetical protein
LFEIFSNSYEIFSNSKEIFFKLIGDFFRLVRDFFYLIHVFPAFSGSLAEKRQRPAKKTGGGFRPDVLPAVVRNGGDGQRRAAVRYPEERRR